MSRKLELLAPGGDIDAIRAAIIAGADAVYCGLDVFNARNRASNVSFEELLVVLRLAHEYDCEVFLTLNIIMLEHEFKSLVKLLSQLANTTLDGVIVQDLGLFYVIKKYFPTLDVHASTQMTTHNEGQLKFLSNMGASRVNLSREMNLEEIKQLSTFGHDHDLLVEVFVHGSLCVAFSGLCYSTSASVGNSGNRGRCSQACREEYEVTESGNQFPLNLKDNSALLDLPALIDAGVDSLKIEGRIKGANYVHTVVDSWRKQIDGFIETGLLTQDRSALYKVFNRDFSNEFLTGKLSQSMFIDNPMDHAMEHAVEKAKEQTANDSVIPVVQIQEVYDDFYQEKNQSTATVEQKIQGLPLSKPKLALVFVAKLGEPLTVIVTVDNQGKINASEFYSASNMVENSESAIDQLAIEKRFKPLAGLEYELNEFDVSQLGQNLSVPFKELTQLKKQVAKLLNNNRQVLAPVELPKLKRFAKQSDKTELSILISDINDAHLAELTNADVYFKLPDSFKKGCTKYAELLANHKNLIPWFPAVLIGKDYIAALHILNHVKPKLIVSNNTGIAQAAKDLGIEWIAGPFLNTSNSYALEALKEEINASGAFISNEINQQQIKHIARPENFKLYYSIYHPILLMASRQCFFQQTVGCKKPAIDDGCMLKCTKATSITNLKGESFAIDKQKAGYPSIYNGEQFLNAQIVKDLSSMFDGFMIDLTNIGSGGKDMPDKEELIVWFEKLLQNDSDAGVKLGQMVSAHTNKQYINGL